MKKIGKFIKSNTKLLAGIILGATVSGGAVYAATTIASSQVGYDNSTSGLAATDVQGALDELYVKANKCDKVKIISNEQYEDLSSMFKDSYNNPDSPTCLDLSNWNTSAVISMYNMFSGTSSLTSLDLSEWNTINVIDMSYMFSGTSSLTSLDLSNWNTSAVKYMDNMFSGANPNLHVTINCNNTNLINQINSDLGSGHYTCAI